MSNHEVAVACKICDAPSVAFEKTIVLKRHLVQYFRCTKCGFMQTETPYWLEEAYSSAIATQDVGVMQRNLLNCQLTTSVLNVLFPKTSKAVDFGAGHGVFVRLMRDRGYNFLWSDLYATNDYAKGFESQKGAKYDFLTAFEVLEHLVDPVKDIQELMNTSNNVFVSTCMVPNPTPALSDWWYYMPSSGQHIAFYTQESLRILAAHFGRHIISAGPYHLFTTVPQSKRLFRLATNFRWLRLINRIRSKPSLVQADLKQMTS